MFEPFSWNHEVFYFYFDVPSKPQTNTCTFILISASSSAGVEEEPIPFHHVWGLLTVPEHWFIRPRPLRGGALLVPVCQRLPVPHGLQTQREEPQSILLQFKPERPEQRGTEPDAQPPATAGQTQGEEGQEEEEEGIRAAEPGCR